jgi:catechol 1,2-dioxygenase
LPLDPINLHAKIIMANPTTETTKPTKANGQNGSAPQEEGLGQAFTQQVIDSFGPKTDPRLREVMSSFVQHMHDFARETQLTVDEWMTAVKMINWAGQMSNEKRNEGQLMCDVIGLER